MAAESLETKSAANQPYLIRNISTIDAVDTKASLIGDEARAMLSGLNVTLAEYADRIKSLQKNSSGSITLHLRHCGDKGCLGCPHPSWHLWYNPTKGRDRTKYTSKLVQSPLIYLRRKTNADEIKDTIKKSQKLIEYRASVISHLSALNKTVMRIHEIRPDLLGASNTIDDVRKVRIMEDELKQEKPQ